MALRRGEDGQEHGRRTCARCNTVLYVCPCFLQHVDTLEGRPVERILCETCRAEPEAKMLVSCRTAAGDPWSDIALPLLVALAEAGLYFSLSSLSFGNYDTESADWTALAPYLRHPLVEHGYLNVLIGPPHDATRVWASKTLGVVANVLVTGLPGRNILSPGEKTLMEQFDAVFAVSESHERVLARNAYSAPLWSGAKWLREHYAECV